jgi:hypothetical protein
VRKIRRKSFQKSSQKAIYVIGRFLLFLTWNNMEALTGLFGAND